MRSMGLTKALSFAAAVAVSAISTAASAVTVNYSSAGNSINDGGLWIEGSPLSGSFDLSPGVSQDETVWSWFLFANPTQTFSGKTVDLELTLNGVSHTIPFLASATEASGAYSFAANGTVQFTIAGVGIVEVTGIDANTTISDPAHAGPIAATFLLERTVTGTPEPTTLALVGAGIAGLAVKRRKRRNS